MKRLFDHLVYPKQTFAIFLALVVFAITAFQPSLRCHEHQSPTHSIVEYEYHSENSPHRHCDAQTTLSKQAPSRTQISYLKTLQDMRSHQWKLFSIPLTAGSIYFKPPLHRRPTKTRSKPLLLQNVLSLQATVLLI